MDKYSIVAIVLTIVLEADAAKILAVFPAPSISHQVVFRPLTQELVKRGHEVVVITTDPAYSPGEAPVNFTEIDVGNISYHCVQETYKNADVGKYNDIYKQVKSLLKMYEVIIENQLQIKPIEDIIKNRNNVTFDLLLLEMTVRSSLAFSYVYKAPVVLITSSSLFFDVNAKVGIPSNPLLYPVIPRQRLYNLTYWEKIKEVFGYYYVVHLYESFEHEENALLKKYFGRDTPQLSELYSNVHMLFQNIHPILMDNPPVPPNIIYLGGLHQKPTKELPQDLDLYLNSSTNGVIYVSFGTNVKTSLLPPEKVQMMVKVFSNLPYNVLWKMDTQELSGIAENIRIFEWLPQADLLKHPNIKAFIMQGGQQSTDEAITAGVPLIGIPMYGDQCFHVEKYVRHKIGIKLDWYSLTEEEFKTAILTVTEDTSYRKNIRRLNRIINDRRQSPLERAIWWTEHVLRLGDAKHLRAPTANMSWAEYYEIDLVIIITIFLTIALFSLVLSLRFIWLRVAKTFSSKVKKSLKLS